MPEKNLSWACLAEFCGTFLLVFIGTGAVFVAVLTGGLSGSFQVGIVWGVVVALAIYATGAISGAHLNPAVTLAASLFRGFPARKILPYLLAQVAGAGVAAVLLFFLFCNILGDFEKTRGIVRGQPGSELSAMVFGEYFPNPAIFGVQPGAYAKVSELQAMAGEAVGTGLLVFFVFALTDPRNRHRPHGLAFAVLIGVIIAILIAILAPITQAGFNPARDFGPRLASYFLGWGPVAIPGPRGGFFTVYILSPILGGLAGGAVYDGLIRPALPKCEGEAVPLVPPQAAPVADSQA